MAAAAATVAMAAVLPVAATTAARVVTLTAAAAMAFSLAPLAFSRLSPVFCCPCPATFSIRQLTLLALVVAAVGAAAVAVAAAAAIAAIEAPWVLPSPPSISYFPAIPCLSVLSGP